MGTQNSWERWDKEVENFINLTREYQPPAEVMIGWRRRFLLIFMQELSKNLLHGTFGLLIEKIIEAIQIACNFACVRVYLVDEENKNEIYLYKKSKDHDPIGKKLRLKIKKGIDAAVDTLISREPLIIEDAAKVKLIFRDYLKLKGLYMAIPLLVEKEPVGLICANMSSQSRPLHGTSEYLKYAEFLEEVDAFIRSIMAAVENRKIFEQRNQKIKQLKLIDKLAELIQSETKKKKLLNSLVEYSVNLVGATGGHLKLRNIKTGEWEKAFVVGKDVKPPEITNKPDELGFYNLVLVDKNALIINDLEKHPFMRKNKEFCIKHNYQEYLSRLENRKSALIVPLAKHDKEVIGVLYVHSDKNNKFSELDKENLLALVNSVINVIDKTQQLEQQSEFLVMRDGFLAMLQEAVGKAYNLNSVLQIIRDSCYNLLVLKKIEIVCLSIKDPQSGELTTPSVKCSRSKEKDCSLCFKEKEIIKKALKEKKPIVGEDDLASPIFLENDIIGVLYLQGKGKIILTPNEEKILQIIISTAAILIKTARNYETKIHQVAAIYEAIQFTAKMQDFREWFHPVMERVMDIIDRENRNFHLALIEGEKGHEKLVIRATSPFFVEGKKINVEDKLLNSEIPMDNSLSGMAVKEKISKYIPHVKENWQKSDNDSTKLKFYDDGTGANAEVCIPLKIKEGKDEKVIGVLIFDSVKPNDFRGLDITFHETIAHYLAIAIHSQQLYEDRAKFQDEIRRRDRANEISVILNSFFHEIKDPLGEINSAINLIEIYAKESQAKKYINEAKKQSYQVQDIFKEFVDNFAKTIHAKETKKLTEMIKNALQTIEKTLGINIKSKGNYLESELEMNCYPTSIELAFRSIIHNAEKFYRGLPEGDQYLEIGIKPDKKNNTVAIGFESSTFELLTESKLKTISSNPLKRVIKRRFGGGLGLALADLSVKLNFGEIKAENVGKKQAVRFTIILPIDIDKIIGDENDIIFK